MNIGILEDEEIWSSRISKYINQEYTGCSVKIYDSCNEFVNNGMENEIVLFDVELKDGNGFEMCSEYRSRKRNGIAIIVSSHEELSREGYKVNALRYVDKYYLETELKEALNAAFAEINYIVPITFHIVNLGEIELDSSEIIYIETEKRNIIVHTEKGNYICKNNISELAKKLEQVNYYQPHRSYLINLDKIQNIKDRHVIMNSGDRIQISSRKYGELKSKYIKRLCDTTRR